MLIDYELIFAQLRSSSYKTQKNVERNHIFTELRGDLFMSGHKLMYSFYGPFKEEACMLAG